MSKLLKLAADLAGNKPVAAIIADLNEAEINRQARKGTPAKAKTPLGKWSEEEEAKAKKGDPADLKVEPPSVKVVEERPKAKARGNTSPAPKAASAENAKAIAEAPKPLPKGTLVDGIDCSGMFADPRKEGIPVYLQRQNAKALTPAMKAKIEELAKARPLPPEERSDALRAAQKVAKREQAKAKAAARKEKREAAEAGKTTAMPLSGKAAIAAIKAGKGKAAKAAKAAPAASPAAPKGKPAKKAAAEAPARARYDWNGAREAAAKGKVPAAPDFSADTHRFYRPLLAEVEKLVKARDLAGLQRFKINGSNTSPAAVKRYRDIAIIALKAKA